MKRQGKANVGYLWFKDKNSTGSASHNARIFQLFFISASKDNQRELPLCCSPFRAVAYLCPRSYLWRPELTTKRNMYVPSHRPEIVTLSCILCSQCLLSFISLQHLLVGSAEAGDNQHHMAAQRLNEENGSTCCPSFLSCTRRLLHARHVIHITCMRSNTDRTHMAVYLQAVCPR